VTFAASRRLRRRDPERHALRWRNRPGRLIAAGGLLLVVAFCGWLLISLFLTDRNTRSAALDIRSDLNSYHAALLNGNTKLADQWLSRAEGKLASADHGAAGRSLRIAAHLPVLSGAVSDLHSLLGSADLVVRSAQQVIALYGQLTGTKGLFHNSQFDLPAIGRASQQAREIGAELATARQLLTRVHGGLFEGGVTSARARALEQIDSVDGEIRSLVDLFSALPDFAGAHGPRTYLVVILNPAEERFVGGAPLGIAALRFTRGRLDIVNAGHTSDLTGANTATSWRPVPGDPWLPKLDGKVVTSIVNADVDPDFRISGEELSRAYEAQFGTTVDGVIALDPQALADLLVAVGPIHAVGYGTLTSRNLVPVLIGASYRKFDPALRHRLDNLVMSTMVSELARGGHLLSKFRALAVAAPGRHLQLYFRDPALETLVLDHHMGGKLPVTTGDFAAVYSQNDNGSKTDFYQFRTVSTVVNLLPDGSAQITRLVALTNLAPRYPGRGRDPGGGYLTGWNTDFIANYLPRRAETIGLSVNGVAHQPLELLDDGYIATEQWVRVLPGQTSLLMLTYRLPDALTRTGPASWVYSLELPVQPTVHPTHLIVRVTAPANLLLEPAPGWSVAGNEATLEQAQLSDVQLALPIAARPLSLPTNSGPQPAGRL